MIGKGLDSETLGFHRDIYHGEIAEKKAFQG